MFSISTFLDSFGPLFWAARYTLLISVLGIALGLVIGALVCAAALSRVAWLRRLAALWVSFLRGVPLLVQLLLFYYLLPVIGIDVPALVAAVVTVGICASAYISEIWRGAIVALPKGQSEAATAIGMGPRDIWVRVVLPQAFTMSLPALVNELILLVKASSLVSVVGILELTRASQAQAAMTFRPLEVYLAAACIYLLINLCLAALGRYLEHRRTV
ncbi:amino acid ABC transporter permease [Brucella sp. 6810]|uniref:Amino acid ABC transporter permease n=1 Tax=Brucella inopinata TaxID=1218315 RepID=A0AAW7BC65_9HYPH|nr:MULTISPECIES: amino acid ABC transporter permease [Brucella]KEY04985.1 amino acid ABC transporter [Brucella suis bv. 4 str. 40]EFM56058.1 amino acid ABC transporter, permease protein, 3-TM region, His/Glu/Gln/Arg/opine family [Brucella inopinata BO1]EFM60116.1 amino acid ABC transporter, permease protein, 3-TM region, His/Glu/Gln/Arg/opine family [Brucella sp. BO2]MDL2333434.1 amino acid ABC transporter permease [Brucella inopinata]QGA58787.1 ABC transporter permease subunit [Brucella sp. 2